MNSAVTENGLSIFNTEETMWMSLHAHERDLLEDTMYLCLTHLWSEFSNAITVFDDITAFQPLCAKIVWEALLAAFPL